MDALTAAPPPRLDIVKNGRQTMNGFKLLRALSDNSAACVVLDPQYRTVLDAMNYGNEGKSRERARAALPAMNDQTIAVWIEQVERILRPSGHLLLWTDKFTIAEGKHLGLFRYAPNLKRVDLIAWNKLRPGMGRRARCYTEYLVVAQKEPTRAKDVWTDNSLPDCWLEQSDRSDHPHAKPHQLTERLIRAVTKRGDMVVDPCAGSYGVLDACRNSGRVFIGCDIMEEKHGIR